jgi:dihydrofolate reductase
MPAMTRIALIASVARNGAIGKGNDLLWREPQDQQHFRRTTLGFPVVMGRKTWESLPARFRPLPGRTNIVVTRNPAWQAEGAQVAPSLDAALALVRDAPKVFVIGGGELYAAAMPLADELVLTEIDAEFDADTFFPPYADRFTEVSRETHLSASGVGYAIVTYRRKA